MGKTAKITYASYRAMPDRSRFWVYSEHCYTADDLDFRDWIIKTRTNSGIHPDYLSTPSSWFAEENQALINVYPNSWLFSAAFKPRHLLTREDFHVQPIDGLRLNWPSLYDLMQKVGDYLHLRNQDLATEHLNQPMNYVLLDINSMLKGLSQNANIEQVKEQLELITRYIRTIEKNVSPLVGSDRLFLANFRGIIHEKVMPPITHMIESRLLQDRLQHLSKIIRQVSTERNRVLHFALTAHSVNPHPYDFAIGLPEDSASYPTQAAKACLEQRPLLTDGVVSRAPSESLYSLKDCPHFNLITSDDEISDHYARAIADLNELENFQKIINQINGLLDQAGEVYTIHQFKEQMLGLLEQITHFLDESSVHVEAIIDANTQSYHKAIQDQQDLSILKKWFTNEEDLLKSFIKNQDTLAQFPSGLSELAKTKTMVQNNAREIIKHLSQPREVETSFAAIAEQAQELDKLMGSMHHWITVRYQSKGLPAPQAPAPIKLIAAKPEFVLPIVEKPITLVSNGPSFFSSATFTNCPTGSTDCPVDYTPPTMNANTLLALGLIVIIPAALIGLYLLLNRGKENNEQQNISNSPSKKRKFEKLVTQFEDLLAQLKGFESRTEQDLSEEYEHYLTTYLELKTQAQSGRYNVSKLQEAFDDLEYFYEEYRAPSETARAS